MRFAIIAIVIALCITGAYIFFSQQTASKADGGYPGSQDIRGLKIN